MTPTHPAFGVGQRNITYDQDNMPTQMVFNGTSSDLFYDGTGSRVKKVSGGQTTVYVGGLYEIRGSDVILNIFAGGQRVASIKNSQKFFNHGDHLGSTSLVTNESGQLVEEIGYLPFGATLFRNAYQDGAWTSVYRFTGQEYDAEFALYNYNARLYDPVTGRFITADTVVPDWTNPQTLNRYAYCANNPLKYVDPSGHDFGFSAFCLAIFYGALIGAAAGGIIAAIQGGDVWQGITQGAITGAISGAMFYAASFAAAKIGTAMVLEAGSQAALTAARLGMYVTAGAASGAINASITGGNVGQGALIGGLSAGISQYGGKAWQRILIGSAMGGISSVASGGGFFEGAWQGAWTSAVAMIAEEVVKMGVARANSRGLTNSEISEARKVFGNKIDYSKVRIINGKYFPLQGEGDVMSPDGNIYWPGAPDDIIAGYGGHENDTFIHEMTHVWQYQHGVNVLGNGFVLQASYGLTFTLYNPYLYVYGHPFSTYNIEQQGNYAVNIYNNRHSNNIP